MSAVRLDRGLLSAPAVLAACLSQATEPSADAPPLALEAETRVEIRAADLQAHVDWPASDALGGRPSRGPGGALAARYVAAWFERYGLEPAGDGGSWFQAVASGLSPNVVGRVPGTGPDWVLVSAHYDHLEPLPATAGAEEPVDRIFNGADDNASGVAAMLEVAEAVAHDGREKSASIVFVAFTGEEIGLRGSRHFAAHPPFDLARLLVVINLDMVSRGDERTVFVERNEGTSRALELARRAAESVELSLRVGEHPEWLYQSDHVPFHRAGVPFLYFGVEDHEDYHRVSDHSDKILPELVRRVAEVVRDTAVGLAATGPARSEVPGDGAAPGDDAGR